MTQQRTKARRGRVLFHVQHLLGVGHVKRAAALCTGMTAAGLDVTVAYGGMPVEGVSFGDATVVHLPAARARDAAFSGLVDADGQAVDKDWWRRRETALRELYSKVRPDVFLVEHFPFGRRAFRRELLPVFELARAAGTCRIVSSVRDILVDPLDAGKSAMAIGIARDWFDAIMVHGDATVIRLEDTFPAAAALHDRMIYTGYVSGPRRESTGLAHQMAGERPGPAGGDGRGDVLVSAGGGAVGGALFRAAMAARLNGCLSSHTWRFLAGGNLEADCVAELSEMAPTDVIVEPARPDFPDMLARCSLSISQAGYNTVMDLLAARCPAVVVPFAAGGETEQSARARLFAAAGLFVQVSEDALAAETLADAAVRAVNMPPAHDDVGIDLDGVATTGRLIADMIADRDVVVRHV